jgi:putative membrane protein
MSLGELLPTVNAILNATSAVLISLGFWSIRHGERLRHRAFMLTALATSGLFLLSYVTRVLITGTHRFPELGMVKVLYLVVLSSHMLLAILVVPLVLVAVFLALKERFRAHRKIVRWAWPIWIYVSVTGVVVYLMLYHLAPLLAE